METQNQINPGYGRPVLFQNQGADPPPIIINQPKPVALIDPKIFKTTKVAVVCIFCQKPITTQVIKKCNFWSGLFCCSGFCIYLCVQSYRDKDICCYDAKHYCPNCRNLIGSYTSC